MSLGQSGCRVYRDFEGLVAYIAFRDLVYRAEDDLEESVHCLKELEICVPSRCAFIIETLMFAVGVEKECVEGLRCDFS